MYPIMLNLTDKNIVVIGGGTIALRKTKAVVAAGGSPVIIAPKVKVEFTALERVRIMNKVYQKELIQQAHLIFACTNSQIINQQVVDDAQDWQWVNDCSKQDNSDFFNMATIEYQSNLIAVSSFGRSPSETKQLKKQLLSLLELL